MKKILLALACLLSVLSYSQDAATTTSILNLRESNDKTSKTVTVIPQGAHIYIDNCQGDWCQTSYHGQAGYVNKAYLKYAQPQPQEVKTTEPKATSSINYYTNVDGNKIQSPTHYDKTPVGASAQCADGTFSFSQHRRGTCSHHGGVARWL